MVLARILQLGRGTKQVAVGVWKVATNPDMVVKADVHPRLFGRPFYLSEWIRSYSWRHNWKYVPIWRTWIMAFGVVYILIFHLLPVKPRHWIAYENIYKAMHHWETGQWYGLKQRMQDEKYYKEFDPMRKPGEHVILPGTGGGH